LSTNIDQAIEKIDLEIAPLIQKMEEQKTQFITSTITFAIEWYKKTAKLYATKYHQVTLNMNESKMVQMKTYINQLIQNSQKTITEELNRPTLWWHKRPNINDSTDQYLQVDTRYPQILDNAVRHVLGLLGLILQQYGYNIAASGNTGSYNEFWFKRLPSTNQTLPYFPHLLDWSPEMQQTIRKYNQTYLQALSLYKEVHELRDEKKKQLALQRWDLT
jgi:hypothetical protein